ncbi:hypothetical protein PGRAN_14597 [Listeria grandensis FSL F6-0971]|uniref:Uncharacterized protein n=2 Tax=Listeria grandensis TaxID=1494963 RepID=W7B3Z9_9LIST|nr:hypothetical protein PGRAN_14597 [Listeria grandensis FSL F6-0971]
MKKFIIVLTSVMLFSISIMPLSTYATEGDVSTETYYNGENFTATKDGNTLVIQDKQTSETVTLEMKDDENGVMTSETGETEHVHRDEEGNVYVNNKLEVAAEADLEDTIDTPKLLLRATKWIYVQTTKYNTSTQGNMRSIALGILSFMPIKGPIFGIVGIIDAARSMGAKTLYVRVKQYRTSGYQFYKYDSYFYANASLTKLVKKISETKRMW